MSWFVEHLHRDGSVLARVPVLVTGLPESAASIVLGHAGDGFSPGYRGSHVNQFYAYHGGVNFLFADGHVSMLNPSMDYATYRALATRAGHETVAGDF